MTYASETKVSVEQSHMEIERILMRYKADAFAYFNETTRVSIGFRLHGRMFRMTLTLPDPKDREFTYSSRGMRPPHIAQSAWEQACRQKWRALALVIKAKLEAVSAGISTLEDEFLAHTLLPNGQTVSDWCQPQITDAYIEGKMPTQLLLTNG